MVVNLQTSVSLEVLCEATSLCALCLLPCALLSDVDALALYSKQTALHHG